MTGEKNAKPSKAGAKKSAVRKARKRKQTVTQRDLWCKEMREKGYIDFHEAIEIMGCTSSTARKFVEKYDVKRVKKHNTFMMERESFMEALGKRAADKYVNIEGNAGTDRARFRREQRQLAIENRIPVDSWTLMPAAARQLQIDYRAILNMVKNKRIQSQGFGFDDRRVRIVDIIDYINETNMHVSFGHPAFKAFKDGGERFLLNGGEKDALKVLKKD